MMKIAVLYLALYCNNVHGTITSWKGIGKICLVSFIGTFIEIIGLLVGASYTIFILGVHLLEVPFMMRFLLEKGYKKKLRIIVSGYFFIMLINGVLEALWNQFGESGSYIFYLVFSCAAVIVGVRIWKNDKQMQKGVFSVVLTHQSKETHSNAFYDSGNHLTDPYTGKGVHIISAKLWEKVRHGTIVPVYIPYQALGNEKGILEVYYIDELSIEGEKGRIMIQKCPIGVTKDNLFEGKKYEIILNEEVF